VHSLTPKTGRHSEQSEESLRSVHRHKRITRFGLFFFIGITVLAAIIWYRRRAEPPLPPKTWTEKAVPGLGVVYRLKTDWQQGKMRYIFSIESLDKSLNDSFDAMADKVDGAETGTYSLNIALRDANDLEVCLETVPIVRGQNVLIADPATGKIRELEFAGSSPTCRRNQYIRATHYSVSANLPALQAPTSH
jgi:hypothetical protein